MDNTDGQLCGLKMTESEPTTTAGETTFSLNQQKQDDIIIDIENQDKSLPTRQLQTVDESSPMIANADSAADERNPDSDSGSLFKSSRPTRCDCATTPSPVADSSLLLNCSLPGTREARDLEVQFHVGQERQLMVGRDYEVAAVSPVFQAMFCDRWQKSGDTLEVDIPDVGTKAFAVILRCASQDTDLDLTEDTVWDVLKAADKYQVLPLVSKCFYFLLHKHKLRRSSRHLCMVMETAHRLNYSDHHAECMTLTKRRAGKIFKSRSGLSELCRDCMLALVTEEDLRDVPEILVHEAILTWASSACSQRGLAEPGWRELRTAAGELVHQVRYLAMPRHTLKKLSVGQPRSCLLTEQEMNRLLNGDARGFPATVNRKRKRCEDDFRNRRWHTCLFLKKTPKAYWASVIVGTLVVLLLLVVGVWFLQQPSDPDESTSDRRVVGGNIGCC